MRLAGYLVMSAAIASASTAQRPMRVLLLPPSGVGEATIAWDAYGTPIILDPITDATARKLSALSRPKSCRDGVIYQATVLIDSLRHLPKWANGVARDSKRADLLDVVRTYPTRRSDAQLRPLLNEVALGGGELCRVDNMGHLQAIAMHKP
jgi:hypothetical protein